MWIVAGVLLGATLLAGLVGLHAGPHVHVAAAVAGLASAGWLIAMAMLGTTGSLLYVLLGADLAASAGIGVGAWRAIHPGHGRARFSPGRLEGVEGVAVSPLRPDGVVRVRGEEWSAHALNGPVEPGGRVQVIRADGVRLEVWAEQGESG
jgi:membrane protein implicated in regulation of membrane protease activity